MSSTHSLSQRQVLLTAQRPLSFSGIPGVLDASVLITQPDHFSALVTSVPQFQLCASAFPSLAFPCNLSKRKRYGNSLPIICSPMPFLFPRSAFLLQMILLGGEFIFSGSHPERICGRIMAARERNNRSNDTRERLR